MNSLQYTFNYNDVELSGKIVSHMFYPEPPSTHEVIMSDIGSTFYLVNKNSLTELDNKNEEFVVFYPCTGDEIALKNGKSYHLDSIHHFVD